MGATTIRRGLQPLRKVLGNWSIVAAELGFAAFCLVLHGSWVATMLYAFEQGGVAEAGVVAFVVLVPGALAAPFVAVFFDRFAPHLALAIGFGLQAFGLIGIAITIAAGAPAVAVYVSMALFTVSQMASRPTISSVLPRVVHDPAELVAANAVSGAIETVGLFLGPAAAGFLLLTTGSLAVIFFSSAAAMTIATALAMTLSRELTIGSDLDQGEPVESIFAAVKGGLGVIRRQAGLRHIVLLLATGRLIVGALDVGVVAIAVDQLARDDATAGWLAGAIGVGALIGGALTFTLVGRRRLSLPVALGLLVASIPLVATPLANALLPALLLMALSGLGRPILDVAGRTVLQGLSPDDTLARIFGVLEGLSFLAVALGSIGFSILAATAGLGPALIITGLVPPAILAVLYRKLRAIDHARPTIEPALVALTRSVPIFAPLSAFRTEQMLINMQVVSFAAKEVVFTQGQAGDRLYIVASGSALIELSDRTAETPVGGFFGEIALITDEPRMATVRAGESGLQAYTLERSVFLDAIASAPRSRNRTDRVIEQRLAGN